MSFRRLKGSLRQIADEKRTQGRQGIVGGGSVALMDDGWRKGKDEWEAEREGG